MKADLIRARKDAIWASLVILLVLLNPGATLAQTASGKSPDAAGGVGHITELRGEWEHAGAAFACKVMVKDEPKGRPKNPDLLSRACQRMGPFVVGDDARVLKATLGAPHRTLPQPHGAQAWIYFLEQQEHYPYFVATVSKSRITALQVTGTAAAKGYSFNHIDLGMTTDELVQVFGQPSHFEPSEEKDTELWTYGLAPFSFEIRDGHVTSIRIKEP